VCVLEYNILFYIINFVWFLVDLLDARYTGGGGGGKCF